MNSSAIDKFYTYLEDLDRNYSRLKDLLQTKLIAIGQNNLPKLDDIIKEEQVYVLLSKGFEANITLHRDALHFKGDTLSAVITELPVSEQERFTQVFHQLQLTLSQVKELNGKCQSMIEERLYDLDKSIKNLDKNAATTYAKPGEAAPAAGSGARVFTKAI